MGEHCFTAEETESTERLYYLFQRSQSGFNDFQLHHIFRNFENTMTTKNSFFAETSLTGIPAS